MGTPGSIHKQSSTKRKRLLPFLVFLFSGTHSFPTVLLDAEARQSVMTQRKATIQKSKLTAVVAITAVRNVEEEAFLERLEIEVKNISNKPIYYLLIVVRFPDLWSTALDGVPRNQVIPLHFGRRDLLRERTAIGDDQAINPQETYVFKIPEQYRKGLEDRLAAGTVPDSAVKRITIWLDSLSFGDGTGFSSGQLIVR